MYNVYYNWQFVIIIIIIIYIIIISSSSSSSSSIFFYLSDEVFADRIPYCSKCEGVVKPGEFSNTSQGGGIKAQIIVTLIP